MAFLLNYLATNNYLQWPKFKKSLNFKNLEDLKYAKIAT